MFIQGVGFSNKSKFQFDEQTNRLTIISLDSSTVGFYSAVDSNWRTFTTIVSALNISSFRIEHFRISSDQKDSSLLFCSISILRSTFENIEKSTSTNRIETLPKLNLFVSNRNDQIKTNEFLLGQNLTRTIEIQRRLTRADHNETVQCQVESALNNEVFLIKRETIDFQYGPNLEAGALDNVQLTSEVMKIIEIECQIEANPSPSFVWYEISSNRSMLFNNENVFGTTKQIQRIYQHEGNFSMQCQAQSNGKTVQQNFLIHVRQSTNSIKTLSNFNEINEKSNKIPMIVGLTIAAVFLLLILSIAGAMIFSLKRRKSDPNSSDEQNDKTPSNGSKSRWGNLPIDYSKSKVDSSSTSHLVESAETSSIQNVVPPVLPARPSPMTTNPTNLVSLSYRQASALPGFRPLDSIDGRSNSRMNDDEIPSTIYNRSRTTTPLGSHRSLSESIQSLRSNQQQHSLVLPMKKRSNDEHHYQNPIQLQIQREQMIKSDNNTSEEDEETSRQSTNNLQRPVGYNPVHFTQDNRVESPFASEKILLDQMKFRGNDEPPPSYHQVTETPSRLTSYVYREPTEV